MSDVFVGVFVGLFQGVFFHILFGWVAKSFTNYCVRVYRSPSLIAIVPTLMASIAVGFFLILTLGFRDLVTVWDRFLMGWGLGFFIGGISWSIKNWRKKSRIKGS
jgi:hypothetical protein